MPATCPHCQTHFPSSDTINSRHKAVCEGWKALGTAPKAVPCLCGHEATSLTQMKRHRSTCATWKARDRGELQAERTAQTLSAKHGVGTRSARDIPEAEERRKQTNRERYGAENPFSREATTFGKVQASLNGKRPVMRGPDNPFARPEVQAKIRETNLGRYGRENPRHAPEVMARARATNLERYGVEEILNSPEIRERILATCLERYGGPAPSCSAGVMEKTRQGNLERWGVDWTSQHPEVRAKQLETMLNNYGCHYFASEEGKAEIKQVLKERYGVDHIWQLAAPGINGLESDILGANPELQYTGDGKFWRFLPRLNRPKNPDFIIPGPNPDKTFDDVRIVVEALGDYWHSEAITKKPNQEHEQELIDAFADVGITCITVWEGDFRRDPGNLRARILAELKL